MIKHTDSIVAVQDLRTSLASIADRAAQGESFLVMRNSRPVVRIVPAEDAGVYPAAAPRTPASLGELRARYQASGLAGAIKPGELEELIRAVHQNTPPRG